MTFQANLVEITADFRGRAAALADSAIATARAQTGDTVKRVDAMGTSLTALRIAGRELNAVARRHLSRFVKENAGLARDAGMELTELARSTYSKLVTQDAAPARKARKSAVKRRTGARSRKSAKAA